MQHLGFAFDVRNVPVLDSQYIPMSLFCRAFQRVAKIPITICVERNNGLRAVFPTCITGQNRAADAFYLERTVKFLLWAKGGFRVTLCGCDDLAALLQKDYAPGGRRAFDSAFMAQVYEHPFEIVALPLPQAPAEHEQPKPVGGNFSGCRIGFDAGGSDRKVSAVMDGDAVYSEEVVWHPKTEADPAYHFGEIVAALQTAAAKLPRVDSIGVSSAGIYINNRTRAASLFRKVPPEAFETQVKDIYIRAARTLGDLPLAVVNDGDVTALAGAMELKSASVLGIAMGTSEAGGFVDQNGNITGWLNELAFTPVDASFAAPADEWSGDIGCGVHYFSQEAVIRLAAQAGVALAQQLTPGEKLQAVAELLAQNDPRIPAIYQSIGCYLGHTLPYYREFYGFRHVLLLGRVMSGRGGNLILETARRVLAEEYPESDFALHVPDEAGRRLGQSVAAASL
jgi:hypothetical protein